MAHPFVIAMDNTTRTVHDDGAKGFFEVDAGSLMEALGNKMRCVI